MTHTAHENLRHIATEWPALRELLEARTPRSWPPVMGLQHLGEDDEDALSAYHQQAAQERAERTSLAPGERPAPLHIGILDTITALEDELLALADEIASSIQRPAFTVRSASPLDEVARSVALMGAKDQADARRWRFNLAHRDGATAAAWLADRLDGAAGPHRALTAAEYRRVAAVAASSRKRLDRALGEVEQEEAELGLECGCGGLLSVSTGQTDFTVRCGSCGISWTGTSLLDGLSAA